MNILIVINDAPYGSEKAYNALRLGLALPKEREDVTVRVFLMADAVLCALPSQKTPDGYYNLERMFRGLVAKGAPIKACGTCADARGIRELSLIPGIELSTMSQLAQWVIEADKVLTFLSVPMNPLDAQLPFALPGRFYKGNLHTHSTRSDGNLSPEEVCAFYRRMGYDFLSITDHFMEQYDWPIVDTRPCESPEFVTLIGAELHAGRTLYGELWHILANGLPLDFAPPTAGESGPAIARRALDAGAFVTCAHPSWYALSEADVLSLGPVHAIETINAISEDHNDRIDSWPMYEAMLAQGHRYTAITTDDAHFRGPHDDHGRAWTWVRSEALTSEALLAALKRGEFYSSTGPQIFAVEFSAQSVYVRCSPAASLFVTGMGPRSAYLHGRGLIEGELPRSRLGDSPYCRITVRDAHGGRAWTNAVWF